MILVYDIEVFPNLFSVEFKEYKTENRWIFRLTNKVNQLQEMVDFLIKSSHDLTLVGHNSLGYDDLILRAIILYTGKIDNAALKRLSDKIINRDETFVRSDVYKELKYPKERLWVSYDTIELTRVNQLRVGLKYAAILLRHNRIQDLPYEPETILTDEQIEEVIDYMDNDVVITEKLFGHNLLQEKIAIRQNAFETYGVDVHTANDTGVGKAILDVIYVQKSGIPLNKIKDLRSPVDSISLRECISEFVRFDTEPFKKLRAEIEKKWVYAPRFKHSHKFSFDGVDYVLGSGGIHSVDEPGIFVSDDEYGYIDADLRSMYPSIMITNGFAPDHLDKELFVSILDSIVKDRVEAKGLGKLGDLFQKLKAESLKITVNSIYGLLLMLYYWLFAPKALLSVTISGQSLMLDLVEKLHLIGISVISANTDGVVCKVPKNREAEYFQLCKDWETRTKLVLEFTRYKKYVRRDVNNYITITEKGEIKSKGIFYDNTQLKHGNDLAKGYFAPAITKALTNYFVDGIDPMATFTSITDITDYLIAQRADATKFDITSTVLNDDGELEDTTMQKTNRYLVTTLGNGVSLHKDHKLGGKDVSMLAGQHVQILNDIDSYNPKDYNINYKWYEDEVWKVINQIDPPYAKLW